MSAAERPGEDAAPRPAGAPAEGPEAASGHGRTPAAPRRGGLLRRILGVVLVLAALGYVGATIARHWEELQAYQWQVSLPLLLLSIPLLLAVFAFGVFVWGRVLARFHGGGAPLASLLRIWFLSGIAKYIPGKVWQFVAAAGLARRAGLAPVVLLSSLAVYMGFGLVSAGVASAVTLPLGAVDPRLGVAWLAPAALLAAPLLVHPSVIGFGLRLVPRVLHETVLAWRGGWLDGVWLLALSLVYWALYAVPFWLFVDAVVDLPLRVLPLLAGINAISFLIGYLFFLVPAGLGVREAVITTLLAPVVGGAGAAAVIALASRLWIIAAELLGAGLSLALPAAPTPDTPTPESTSP